MKKSRSEELIDEIDDWLDTHSEVFNEIKKDWEEHHMVQPVEHPQQDFACNHCGNCCCFSAEVFPSDIQCWLDEKRYDILCAVFPYTDENGDFIYGFPTQDEFHSRINEILEDKSIQDVEKKAFIKIRDVIKAINSGYDPSSKYCIFYNPKEDKHCMIYDTRPFSCQVYPYELSIFTKTVIPKEMTDTYGYTEDFKELSSELPMCPKECFSNYDYHQPTRCSEDDVYAVLLDKVNFLEFSVAKNQEKEDIISCIIEAYSPRIRFPKMPSDSLKKDLTKSEMPDNQTIKMTFGPSVNKEIKQKKSTSPELKNKKKN